MGTPFATASTVYALLSFPVASSHTTSVRFVGLYAVV
jgi:hypothetical protein